MASSIATSLPLVEDDASETTSHLAERLARRAASESTNGGEVLIDVELDGVRCVVVRSGGVRRARNDTLSPREQEIARMIAEGHPNKTIAAVLEISSWTVNTHLRRMFAKLGVTSRAAMIARLMQKT
ncbi:MAG TPA: helix-turn-helix transcriptional regulator [Thermoanaerobaculia bacterium]|nr:helix-turn-helix transcriptional regulator [Thermoanaerobaculia bacterium]